MDTMNTDTPRTNEALAAPLDRDGDLSEDNAPEVLVKLCKALESETERKEPPMSKKLKSLSGSNAPTCSPSSDTPETDTLRQKLWGRGWSDSYMTMMSHANKLERERDHLRAKYAMHHAEAEKLTEVIRAATVLIAAKGRHNTMLAYEGLRSALSQQNAVEQTREKGQADE